MRAISEELAARLARGVTTLAHVWRIVRRDGAAFGFTDHDRPLVVDGLTCAPATGLAAGAIEKGLGLSVDSASIAGALSADAIDDADLAAGLWDGARVDIYKVDWTAPALKVHLFAGRLGEARRGVRAFEIELRGLQAPLQEPRGRVYSRFCDADLGDARCGVNLEGGAAPGEIVEILNPRAFRASGFAAYPDGWFTRGRVMFEGARPVEVSTQRHGGGVALFELLDPLGPAIGVGASFVAQAGCDKRHATCRDKFANIVNFRGFPFMPGNDVIQAGPPVSGNDGGSRWR